MAESKPIFRDLDPDDPDPEITAIESLCMNCHSNGTTRILLTKIPYYKEVVVMSFSCDHCGYHNNEIQSGAPIGETGIRIVLRVTSPDDLNRQVVKSDFTSVRIAELDFEIPPQSQKGEVTTIEGVINRSIAGLEQDQPLRRTQHPEVAAQIDEFIAKIRNLKETHNFTITLEDASGNCFVENPVAPQKDPAMTVEHFKRSKKQDHELGIFTKEEIGSEESGSGILHPISEGEFTLEDLDSEILRFPTNCGNCGSPCQTNMKVTDIPHFKEVVIMATVCDACGHRTNEVKSGGGIEPQGIHIEVDVNSKEDFSRDVLKSATCHLKIPQLELEVGPHALGGRFTTVEGLLVAVKDQLNDPKRSHIMLGDSQDAKTKNRLDAFFDRFNKVLESQMDVTLVLDDPAGNSYVQSMSDDGQDESLRITKYDRTYDQNEELGLNDIHTENYEG